MNETSKIVFLIPFASRKVKSKWEIACVHLRQTLKSIQNSSSGNYRVVVAGHEAPDFDVGIDTRFVFLSLSHPIPKHPDPLVSGRLDKLIKYAAAWEYSQKKWKPEYVMKLDADDLISSRLVEWLDQFSGEPGYLIKPGWVWNSGAGYLIQKVEYLDRICGSCLIIRSDFADKTGPFLANFDGVPIDEASSRFADADPYSLVPGSRTCTLLLNNYHQRYAAQFAYLGHRLSSIPFNAVVYRIRNPDSITKGKQHVHSLRMWLGNVRRTRFITPRLRQEFML